MHSLRRVVLSRRVVVRIGPVVVFLVGRGCVSFDTAPGVGVVFWFHCAGAILGENARLRRASGMTLSLVTPYSAFGPLCCW